MTAPVQVLVVGFDSPAFTGDVLAELARLREAGIVRLIDLLLVERAEDGTFETLDAAGGDGLGIGDLVAAVLGHTGGEGEGAAEGAADAPHSWSLADVVPPGTTAAVALIEHTWAGPLATAIINAGGTPLEETWLPPAEREALDSLIAQRTS